MPAKQKTGGVKKNISVWINANSTYLVGLIHFTSILTNTPLSQQNISGRRKTCSSQESFSGCLI